MCGKHDSNDAAYRKFQNELVQAGLLIRSGVDGVYGLTGAFEHELERFERYVTRMGRHLNPEVIRFPPLLNRSVYEKTDHLEAFPQLIGSVHSFAGTDREHEEMIRSKDKGEDWSRALAATELVMAPAACYPLYPIIAGALPAGGRTVDLRSFVFRREPSADPARMQTFRMREFVRLGTPAEALAHRDYWLKRGEEMLRAIGLDATPVVANDPFFGRGGRVMAATQREQALKFELVVPVSTADLPTAVFSANYHLDHFGAAFGIRSADGATAHSACVGFGLERIVLALFGAHGFDSAKWPADVQSVLDQ